MVVALPGCTMFVQWYCFCKKSLQTFIKQPFRLHFILTLIFSSISVLLLENQLDKTSWKYNVKAVLIDKIKNRGDKYKVELTCGLVYKVLSGSRCVCRPETASPGVVQQLRLRDNHASYLLHQYCQVKKYALFSSRWVSSNNNISIFF